MHDTGPVAVAGCRAPWLRMGVLHAGLDALPQFCFVGAPRPIADRRSAWASTCRNREQPECALLRPRANDRQAHVYNQIVQLLYARVSKMAASRFGLVEGAAWLAYGAVSALLFRKLCSSKAPRSVVFLFALVLSAVDLYVPFTFRRPAHGVVVSVFLFLFPVTRPAKLCLVVAGSGPLSAARTLKEWLAVAALPVVPVRCLPSHVQTRLQTYKWSAWRGAELALALAVLAASSSLRALVHPDEISVPWSRALHICAFVSFMVALMNGAAALATAAGVQVVEPFNRFWEATSVADWWRYRWDATIALTLRMTVYEPLAGPVFRQGGQTAAFLRQAAGVATFAGSSLIHEYSLVAQGHRGSLGQLSLYFMAQPLLIYAEDLLRLRHRRAPARGARRKAGGEGTALPGMGPGGAVDRAVTVALVLGSVYFLWCPAYDPPLAPANSELGDELLRLLGVCDLVPFCAAPL